MTALSRNVSRSGQTPAAVSPLLVAMLAMPVLGSTRIYQGALVALTPAGYLTNASADASLRVVGVLETEADNSTGSSGDLTGAPTRGAFYFANSSSTDAITDGDIGRPCFVVDNNTVARTSAYGARPVAGRIMGVDSYGVLVEVGVGCDPQSDSDLLVIAGGDLSSSQFYGVDLSNSSGVAKAVLVSGAGQRCIGILQNAPASGAVAIVRLVGSGKITKAVAGGSITSGSSVAMTAAGKLKAARALTADASASSATAASTASCAIGVLLASAGTDLDVVPVLLIPQSVAVTTAA